jgi:hypothetical protein
VARRAIPEEVREAVDHRLKTDEKPQANKIAEELTAQGLACSKGYVRDRALYLHIPLQSYRGGRPKGVKNRPGLPLRGKHKPHKPHVHTKQRVNTLYSRNRDEVLRRVAMGEKPPAIAEALGLSRQQVYNLKNSISPEELEELKNQLTDGKKTDG